jgi:hypothetical protein
MQNNVLLVSCEPKAPERDEEFNAWFNNFHLQQVLRAPGIVAATRYKLSRVQMEWMTPMVTLPEWPYGKSSYLNVYELDPAHDAGGTFQFLRDTEGQRCSADPENDPVAWGTQFFYEAITEKETVTWLKPPHAKPTADRPMAIWVVYSTPFEGAEDENDNWYLAQGNLRSEGFESMIRYKLSRTQGAIDARGRALNGAWPFGEEVNLAIWELADPLTALNSRRRSQGSAIPGPRFSWMPQLNKLRRGGEHLIYEPVTYRVTPIWLKDQGEANSHPVKRG